MRLSLVHDFWPFMILVVVWTLEGKDQSTGYFRVPHTTCSRVIVNLGLSDMSDIRDCSGGVYMTVVGLGK